MTRRVSATTDSLPAPADGPGQPRTRGEGSERLLGAATGRESAFQLLAIDQAETSGWAFALVGPEIRQFTWAGTAKTAAERADVVRQAAERAALHGVDLYVVLEDHGDFHFGRGNMSVRSLLGMGAARGRWAEALELAGVPKSRISMVTPKAWRRAVLGLGGNAKAEHAKAAAQLHARAVLDYDPGPDAAEALCILLWGERNVVVKKKRKAVGDGQ
jgi:hypothetical protein